MLGQCRFMEREPRSSSINTRIWVGLALLSGCFILVWSARSGRPPIDTMRVGFTPLRSGHMGDFYSSRFTVAMVTNTSHFLTHLELPTVQSDNDGVVLTYLANLWGGTNGDCSLGTQETMPLPFEVPTNCRKFRVSFEYWHEAGFFQRLLCPALGKLFSRTKGHPQPIFLWLQSHGWLDGRLHLDYEGGWEKL